MAVTAVHPFAPPRKAESTTSSLVIPAPFAKTLQVRYRTPEKRDAIDLTSADSSWSQPVTLKPHPAEAGCYIFDISTVKPADGDYEYEFLVDGATQPIPDPFARDIVKFGGYRGLIHARDGEPVAEAFSWEDELPSGVRLAPNKQLVIYEMPLHWMSGDQVRQVGLGTFEKAVFEHLDGLHELGINAIELLPIEDSADTLGWGYGTRFFFAPDWDLGSVLDTKFFIKCCHRFGIRVILDVVMNHSRECPLETLAEDWYYLPKGSKEEGDVRQDWGGRLFRYATPRDGEYRARELQYRMAEYWIREYHVDGFRIDEFRGINNWDFLQGFYGHAWAEHQNLFSDRPFLVIAESSDRRAEITYDDAYLDKPLVDSMWNFDFRDEVRRLTSNTLQTNWGQPPRRDRIQSLISSRKLWSDWDHQYRPHAFTEIMQAVNYVTSHDVQEQIEQRLMNYFLVPILRERGLDKNPANPVESETDLIRRIVDNIATQSAEVQAAHADALQRVGSAFALMLTSQGIPMFLAGEEFADIHDIDHTDWRLKQTDPVDWTRRDLLGHRSLLNRVADLVKLRTQHPALANEGINFFYYHPTIDDNEGVRAFAYCRTNGKPLGSPNQVVVLANCGPQNFPVFDYPWFWPDRSQLQERGTPASALSAQVRNRNGALVMTVSLAPFQVRVFTT